ncbi:DUF1345 domain-containing protein [Leifsonia sp. NPDC080035]|uniref:DUF1345 domain-containing protein n=1 Tax=Leifsonia sp. NPDC080035 TaxID=3143936 RepID=A0AAU7GEE7_9MICO
MDDDRITEVDSRKSESPAKGGRISRLRVACMVGAGILTAVVVGFTGGWVFAASAGWAVACAVYVVWVWATISRMDGPATRAHASREDPSKTTSDTLLLVASVASLVAVALLLGQATKAKPPEKDLLAIVAGTSVALSWFFIHTLYTLRYAVLYYTKPELGGISFNQDDPPRYLDFAYLSFTVGMTFQVSDTDISSTTIRAVILRHMMLSYLFGAVILALSVNIVASLAA